MRTSDALIQQRTDIIESALLAGMTGKDIQAIMIDGRQIIDSRIFNSARRAIHTKWLKHDTQWFTRFHTSRIITVKRYSQQLARLNKLLAEDADSLPLNDILGIERLIGHLTGQIHETEKEVDPDMYLRELARANNEPKRNNKISAPAL